MEEAALFGRSLERRLIDALLDVAAGGMERALAFIGPGGAGKTSLLRAAASMARRRGFSVHWAHGHDADHAPPYWIWRQVLRSAERTLGALPTLTDPMLADHLAVLREPDGKSVHPDRLNEEAVLRALAVCEVLRSMTESAPAALLLDDVSEMDSASAAVLDVLLREMQASRIAVILASRTPLEQSTIVSVREIRRRVAQVPLRGLTAEEVAEWMVHCAAGPSPSDQAAEITRLTGGSPFLVAETLRLLRLQAGAPAGAPVALDRIAGLQSIVAHRLRELPPAAKEVLEAAAIVGTAFEGWLVAEVLSTTPADVDRAFRLGRDLDLLRDDPERGRISFSHDIIRQSLSSAISVERSRGIHRKIATALQQQTTTPPATDHLLRIAHHLWNGRDDSIWHEVLRACLSASRALRGGLAFDDAVEWLIRAGEIATRHGASTDVMFEIEATFGETYELGGRHPLAQRHFLRAARLASTTGDALGFARMAVGVAGARSGGPRASRDTIPLLREAAERVAGRDDAVEARTLASLARELTYGEASVADERAEILARADALSCRAGDDVARALVLLTRRSALPPPERGVERLRDATEISRIGSTLRSTSIERMGLRAQAAEYLALCDGPAFRASMSLHRRLVHERRCADRAFEDACWDALVSAMEGSLVDAGEAAERAAGLASTATPNSAAAEAAIIRGVIGRFTGTLGSVAEESREAFVRYADYPATPFWTAWILGESAPRGTAVMALRDLILRHDVPFPTDQPRLLSIAAAAQATLAVRDAECAERLLEYIETYESRMVVVGDGVFLFDDTDRLRGALLLVCDRLDEAELWLEKSRSRLSSLPARPWLAETLVDLAELQSKRDVSRSISILDEARALAAEAGACRLVERCDRLRGGVREAPGAESTVAAPKPAASATFRCEGDVWALAYAGLQVRVRDSKGLQYVSALLARPGAEIHVADLAGTTDAPSARDSTDRGPLARRSAETSVRQLLGDSGEAIDRSAVQAYRERRRALQSAIESAAEADDAATVDAIRAELVFLDGELSKSVGLGGRIRRDRSHVERLRVNVRRTIATAIDRIREHHPELARYLATTIKTGTACRYLPDPRIPIDWEL